jgi:hypothetical protein
VTKSPARRLGLGLLGLGLLAGVGSAAAQNIGRTTGTLTGVVVNSSGSVLPGVTITAASPALVGTTTTVTDAAGRYSLPSLAAGLYEITGELSGFSPGAVRDIDLEVGTTLKVDLTLQVGGLETTVNVQAPIIDVVTAERARNIGEREFIELPKGRYAARHVDDDRRAAGAVLQRLRLSGATGRERLGARPALSDGPGLSVAAAGSARCQV